MLPRSNLCRSRSLTGHQRRLQRDVDVCFLVPVGGIKDDCGRSFNGKKPSKPFEPITAVIVAVSSGALRRSPSRRVTALARSSHVVCLREKINMCACRARALSSARTDSLRCKHVRNVTCLTTPPPPHPPQVYAAENKPDKNKHRPV